MCPRWRWLALVLLAVAAVMPVAASADHVSITAGAGGSLTKLRPTSATVRVTWDATCIGVAPESANFVGNLYLRRPDLGVDTYLGGVFSGSGQVDQIVSRTDKDQVFTPLVRISCFEDGSLHGSDTVVGSGAAVTVPARERDGGGDGGGGGGGGGGDDDGGGSGGAPDQPLHPGGCARELRGTERDDRLRGTAGGDLIRALGGADRVRARSGHDCLVGDAGRDRLVGQAGRDRLTGGSGADSLNGGSGKNAYDGGSGGDRINARNGAAERIDCGGGEDIARVDAVDRTSGCERIRRG